LQKILFVHNYYQLSGGEDNSFKAHVSLLESKGHEVSVYTIHNDVIHSMNQAELAVKTVWNTEVYHQVLKLLQIRKPDIIHIENFFPLISPAVYYAAHIARVPVVQSLRNYRLICPNGVFFRSGQVCEDCMGKLLPWPGVLHACYRGSRSATSVVALMLTFHRLRRSWNNKVTAYIALTQFARQKFIQGGLDSNKILVKPNFVYPDPGIGEQRGKFVLFVSRLSPEKGLHTLMAAWNIIAGKVPLKIVGEGPLADEIDSWSTKAVGVEWLHHKSLEEVYSLMNKAAFLIFPSECYEGFPRTIIEAFARGLPVVASRRGAASEIIHEGTTGLLFEAGNPEDMAKKILQLWEHSFLQKAMGNKARNEYEMKYTADRNYTMLMNIYQQVISIFRK
jgi:glycosyltransferase involved in cell wall biosynthesis